jgi:hypothetical protein
MKISVVPYSRSELNNEAFNPNRLYNGLSFFKKTCEEKGVLIATHDLLPIKEADYIVLFDLDFTALWNIIIHKKTLQTLYVALEPPVMYPWHSLRFLKRLPGVLPYIWTWRDELIDNQHFFKLNIPYYEIRETIPSIPFTQKKLLTTVVSNRHSSHPDELYSKRIELIRFFEIYAPNDFEFYGGGWSSTVFKSYRGKIKDKLAGMAHYKFAICFESQTNLQGYVTEKILDCFNAGVVPIYWGADNIAQYIPQQAYIHYKDFSSNHALLQYIQNMTEKDFESYVLAAREFLSSNAYQAFAPSAFAEKLLKILECSKSSNKAPSFLNGAAFLCALFLKKISWKLNNRTNHFIRYVMGRD